jgi:hypothetical protein
VIHVVTAVITAKGACTMTTSTIENREPAQATATEKPERPKKAKVAAPKPPVTPTKAKSANKTTPAKKDAKAAHKATAARVRQGSKTAKVLELVKRSGGATLKHIMKATDWQAHSVRGFLSGTLGKKMGLKIESSRHSHLMYLGRSCTVGRGPGSSAACKQCLSMLS